MGEPEYRAFWYVAQRNFTQSVLEVPLMVHLLRLPRGRRMLEIGCGRGNAMPAFRRTLRPQSIVGIDIDPSLLDKASTTEGQRPSAGLIGADVRWMPFRDAAFDLVIDFGTCYHIARPELALEEVERVLTDGGMFAYETSGNQLLSHPIRSFGRSLPWDVAKALKPERRRLLWSSRVRASRGEA